MDTGILVSAFVFGGTPQRAVKRVFSESQIYVSPAMLEEYRDVPLALESSGKIDHTQTKALVSGIASLVSKAKIVYPNKRLDLCRDAKDNMLLECCLEAKAGYLITGDKDLLVIKNLPFKLQIVTPSRFISLIRAT